jgi:Tfp pilus assembly protein PilV
MPNSMKLKMKIAPNNHDGFLMMEAILSIALLCAIVMGSLNVISQASKSELEERHRIGAIETGSMVMEELSFSYVTTDSLLSGPHLRYYNNSYSEVDVTNKYYTVSWIVTINSPTTGVSNIDLTVSWLEGDNGHSIKFQTLR